MQLAFCAARAETGAPNILFPRNRSVVPSVTFDLICSTPAATLKVDGHERPWEPFQKPVLVSHLGLAPGYHELQAGRQPLKIFVSSGAEDEERPEGWTVYASHPIKQVDDRCAECHETTQVGKLTKVGRLKSFEACFKCHKAVEFELIHAHPLQPIQHCQMCHALHGSERKHLLNAPVKKLCADCHEN